MTVFCGWLAFALAGEVRDLPHPPAQKLIFRDGDWLRGTVTDLKEEHVHLKLAWGAEVRVPVDRLETMEHVYEDVLVDGILQLEDWRIRPAPPHEIEKRPQEKINELWMPAVANYTLMLPVPDLPERFLLEIRFRHSADRPHYRFGMLPHPETGGNEQYFSMTQSHGRLLYQQSATENAVGQNWNRPLPDGLPPLQTYRMYFDQERERLALFLNEHSFGEWSFSRPVRTRISEETVLLISQPTLEPFAVERVRIRAWNGLLPEDRDAGASYIFVLQNGDVLEGAWTGFSDGQFQIETREGHTFRIPARVLDELIFPAQEGVRTDSGLQTVFVRSRFSGIRLRGEVLETESEETLELRTPNLAEPLMIPRAFLGGVLEE